ncbi:Outer membrane protein TolC [Pontibacter akesuensis]|uniref:Outer membrane protein TolC n=2 Tax=Pontibacter akesuensis TaxID=388950 RepID=A0A1I7G1T2_9BACT|nr:transporter [Pontibacter akesuensis]SFU42387.1 Outer membrane protein TolC [Pontibacter akesuensis]
MLILAGLLSPSLLQAQETAGTAAEELTLEQCVAYALQHRAQVEQALIDETIGKREINVNLSGWLPQVSANYGGTKNLKLQQQPFGDQLITLGRNYTSNVLLEATQTIYSSDLLLAARAARHTKEQLQQNITDTKINTVVDVSKAYYDVLLSQEQLRILNENLARQQKQYSDAQSRYEVGLVDKTDYQRAAITLGNIRSDIKRAQESIKAKVAYLKQLMGFPVEQELDLAYDYESMQQLVLVDTTEVLNFANRIELQQLQTQRELLQLNEAYYKWSFLPTVSAYGTYNWLFFSDEFSQLYNQAYPTSGVGLRVSLPIFQGTRRLQSIKIAQLRLDRLEVQTEYVRHAVNTEYQAALADYKSDYYEWLTVRDNVALAEEVYEVIKLQYDEGIVPYINLIVAETDLRTTQLNYYNALFNLMASKLDYQRAIGTIDIN